MENNLKQPQVISKTSIHEIKIDFLAIQTGKDYSDLKLEEIVSTSPKKESNSKSKKEVCAHCHKRFVTKEILTMHNIVAHLRPQIKLKRVDNLLSKYQPRQNSNNLLSVHNEKKTWICQLCSSPFINKTNMLQHVKFVHKKTKTEKCSKCDVVYSRKADLTRHYKEMHLNGGKKHLNVQSAHLHS